MGGQVNYEDASTHNGNNVFESEKSALEKAIQIIVASASKNSGLVDIIDDLNDYITDHPYREIIGLEKKLTNGNREELYPKAVLLKNRFERRIAKAQLSIVEQKVYVQVLSHILSAFDQYIRPKILSSQSKELIDAAVFERIIEPVHKAIIDFDDCVTKELVSGMLFFLTGKCHVAWDKSC
ncbi:ABC-three component system protein [Marinomonas sp. ef1]|uniref:ABC-three component system protein n=1 Tax=Marinomonas sp. ef1 TaxID=2005043 RepID=UPI000C290197|nr:ABC-three component system protein [Marinomonas sp. ef1]